MPGRRVHPTIVAIVAVLAASQLLWTPVGLARGPAEPAPEPDADNEPFPEPQPDQGAAEMPEPQPEPQPPEPESPTVTEVQEGPPPEGGGMAGNVVSADDPTAKQAQADLEGESLDRDAAGVPERMPPMRIAAWWTMFGTVALGTVGGIFSGLAERQEDEAERLALGFDLETGKRYEYEQHADEYEAILDKGNTYQWVSRGFLIGAGVALAASITLFAVQARREARERPPPRSVALRRVSPFGLEVGF